MGILFGYSEVDYRVLLGGKITIARHVEVIETDTVFSSYRGEARSLEYAPTGVVNSRYD